MEGPGAAADSAAARLPTPHHVQAAARLLPLAYRLGPDLHLCVCASKEEFGAGELPATLPWTECPAEVLVMRLNLY